VTGPTNSHSAKPEGTQISQIGVPAERVVEIALAAQSGGSGVWRLPAGGYRR
jgi:hypothetical protein